MRVFWAAVTIASVVVVRPSAPKHVSSNVQPDRMTYLPTMHICVQNDTALSSCSRVVPMVFVRNSNKSIPLQALPAVALRRQSEVEHLTVVRLTYGRPRPPAHLRRTRWRDRPNSRLLGDAPSSCRSSSPRYQWSWKAFEHNSVGIRTAIYSRSRPLHPLIAGGIGVPTVPLRIPLFGCSFILLPLGLGQLPVHLGA